MIKAPFIKRSCSTFYTVSQFILFFNVRVHILYYSKSGVHILYFSVLSGVHILYYLEIRYLPCYVTYLDANASIKDVGVYRQAVKIRAAERNSFALRLFKTSISREISPLFSCEYFDYMEFSRF